MNWQDIVSAHASETKIEPFGDRIIPPIGTPVRRKRDGLMGVVFEWAALRERDDDMPNGRGAYLVKIQTDRGQQHILKDRFAEEWERAPS